MRHNETHGDDDNDYDIDYHAGALPQHEELLHRRPGGSRRKPCAGGEQAAPRPARLAAGRAPRSPHFMFAIFCSILSYMFTFSHDQRSFRGSQGELRHLCDDPVCPDSVWKLSEETRGCGRVRPKSTPLFEGRNSPGQGSKAKPSNFSTEGISRPRVRKRSPRISRSRDPFYLSSCYSPRP